MIGIIGMTTSETIRANGRDFCGERQLMQFYSGSYVERYGRPMKPSYTFFNNMVLQSN